MQRLDKELVTRKLFETRNQAQTAIENGIIFVDKNKILKSSYPVNENNNIEIIGEKLKYVSKGGLKLEKIINETNINLTDEILLDIGSSTGGFTDCALQNGIKKAYCVDVGSNQLNEKIKNNQKVISRENTDFRKIDINLISDSTIASIDVSFISATKMIDNLGKLPNLSKICLLIKPQFECGYEIAKKYKGVIKNSNIHISIIKSVLNEFRKINFYNSYFSYSPIQGGDGNIEYITLLEKNIYETEFNYEKILKDAFNNFLKKTF